jgi:PAS domain S-box-containing protein
MRKKSKISADAVEPRRRAEARTRERLNNAGSKARNLGSRTEAQRPLHELQVRRTELEMQNVELQKARDEAKASLAKYTHLYEFAPVGYFSLDEQGRILEANLAGAALLGVERSKLVSRRLQRFLAPPSRPGFLAFLARVFGSAGKQVCEGQLLKADGAAVLAGFHAALADSLDGSQKWCRVAVSDLSAFNRAKEAQRRTKALSVANLWLRREFILRQEVEEALRQNEERFNQVAEASGKFIWEVDAKGLYTYASVSVKTILGYTPRELVGKKHFYDLLVPSVREQLKEGVFRTFAERKIFRDFPNPKVSKSGKTVHVETSGVPALDPTGKFIGYRGADTDVTERKRAEEALAGSELRFRTLIEQAPIAISISRNGFGVYANRKLAQMCGLQGAGEWSGRPIPEFFAPQSRDESKERTRRRLLGLPVPDEFDAIGLRTDGSQFPIRVVVAQVQLADGMANIAFITDVTERKQAELESQRSRAEIAHLSRTATLGELSGSLAHELNQPLAAILANAQAGQRFLADDHVDLNEMRDILKDIVMDTQRAGEVIRRLRQLLKKGELNRLPLDLNEVVQATLRLVRNDLLIHNITLQAEYAPEMPVIEGDRVQLQQVLLNLIVNATDAMAQTSPAERRLFVRTEHLKKDGVCVSVSDSGRGMPPDIAKRIFDPFFTTKHTGMGLGLKVCRTIITAHGGQINGTNNPEQGATFLFTLPAAKKEQP